MAAKAITLAEYIEKHYNGNKAAFGRSQGVDRQTVNRWVNDGDWIVSNDKMYTAKRDLKKQG